MRPWYRPVFHLPPQHGTGRRRRRRSCCIRWLEITYFSILRASISCVASRRAAPCDVVPLRAAVSRHGHHRHADHDPLPIELAMQRQYRERSLLAAALLRSHHFARPAPLAASSCSSVRRLRCVHTPTRARARRHTHAHAHTGFAEHNENTARGGVVCCIVASVAPVRCFAVACLRMQAAYDKDSMTTLVGLERTTIGNLGPTQATPGPRIRTRAPESHGHS